MFVVQPYCNSENLRLTYSEVFFPIADANQDIEFVTKIVVKPPKQRRQVGHPKKKKRIRSKGEGKRLKCDRCDRYGYNRRTCKEPDNTVVMFI